MFESSRIFYREMKEQDFEFYYELFSDKAVMKYTYLDDFTSREKAKIEFERLLEMHRINNQVMEYVAVLKESNEAIGIVDYEIITMNQFGGIYEIGYFIKTSYWGKGYGTEIGNAIIDFLFKTYPIHKIVASCNSSNGDSEGVMKKLGMTKEGVLRKKRYKNGEWVDETRYGILREEWQVI